jgi:Mitoribosomal protein mL52
LSVNHNADGILTDSPDFSYLDSRKPTPLNKGQMTRIIRQKSLAVSFINNIHLGRCYLNDFYQQETVLKLNKEIQFALSHEEQLQLEEKAAIQKIIDAKLKPKGDSSVNGKVKSRS